MAVDVARAGGFGGVGDGRGLRAGVVQDLVLVAVRVVEQLVAVFARGGDLRENVLQLARRDALHLALVNDDAEMLLLGQIADALPARHPESRPRRA